MTRIFKYPGKFKIEFELQLPAKAKLLSIQTQLDAPVLWFAVEVGIPAHDYVTRTFTSFATGESIREYEAYDYLGTIQDNHGQVWHFHERARVVSADLM